MDKSDPFCQLSPFLSFYRFLCTAGMIHNLIPMYIYEPINSPSNNPTRMPTSEHQQARDARALAQRYSTPSTSLLLIPRRRVRAQRMIENEVTTLHTHHDQSDGEEYILKHLALIAQVLPHSASQSINAGCQCIFCSLDREVCLQLQPLRALGEGISYVPVTAEVSSAGGCIGGDCTRGGVQIGHRSELHQYRWQLL